MRLLDFTVLILPNCSKFNICFLYVILLFRKYFPSVCYFRTLGNICTTLDPPIMLILSLTILSLTILAVTLYTTALKPGKKIFILLIFLKTSKYVDFTFFYFLKIYIFIQRSFHSVFRECCALIRFSFFSSNLDVIGLILSTI